MKLQAQIAINYQSAKVKKIKQLLQPEPWFLYFYAYIHFLHHFWNFEWIHFLFHNINTLI